MFRRRRLLDAGWIAGASLTMLLCGCADVISPAQPLDPRSFLVRQPDAPSEGPVDKTWPQLYNTERVTAAQDPGRNDPANRPISRTVREAVVTPEIAARDASAPSATAPSTTAPSTQPTGGNTTAVDEVIGSVLGDVDSEPIYADKVLAVLDRALAAEAKKYDAVRFREVAADLIQRQVMEFIHADVEFTAAKRNLEKKDDELATQETIRWRAEQVAHAGGSVELAKRRAIEDGTTLEEMAREHYRLTMTQLYYQRRVVPQIQISAADIRDYYQANRDKEFTQPALVRFRVIRIDDASAGDHEKAIDKINGLRERIESGADFAQVAGEVNDDALLLANKGDPQPGQWMNRGAFVSKPVDDAIWNLQPGQMTKIIDAGDSVYLAKLEQRKGGKVQAFEDQDVQEKIYETLRRAQFNTLRQQVRDELEKKAAIRLNPDMMEVALEMVMQKYPVWAGTAE
jgi:parvulin-like peptidyl-prolyl isomerase